MLGPLPRRSFIRAGAGLAAIIAAGKAPAAFIRSMLAARNGLAVRGAKVVNLALNSPGTGSNFTCEFSKFDQVSDFTWSFWFKPNAYPIHGGLINYSGITSAGNGAGVTVGYGSNTSNMQSDGNYLDVVYNTLSWRGGYYVTNYNDWHHYALVMVAGSSSGSQWGSSKRNFSTSLYFDGSQIKSFSNYNMLNSMDRLYILGLLDGTAERYVNGRMTRICLRPKAMTAGEVSAEYAQRFSQPELSGIDHYWDGSIDNGKVKDHVGNWHLTINGNASIVPLT